MEQIKFSGTNDKLFSRVSLGSSDFKSALIVPETHNAILIKDGQMLQTLSSGKYLISDFVDPKTEPDVFLEILFLSKTAKLKLLWGTTQKIMLYDDNIGESYHAGFSGDFEVQVGDPRKCYLYIVGVAEDLTADKLQERLRSNVVSVMESVVSEFLHENKVPYNKIAVYKKDMSQKILTALSHKLQSEYGIAVFSFNIANIILDSEDEKRLQSRGNTLSCAFCGATLSASDKFCPSCGKEVKKTCVNCHAELSPTDKFCPSCGTKVEN